jgi:hypothetical protein
MWDSNPDHQFHDGWLGAVSVGSDGAHARSTMALHWSSPEVGARPLWGSVFDRVSSYRIAMMREGCFHTLGRRWLAVAAIDGKAARPRLSVDEGGLQWLSNDKEDTYGGGGPQ